MLKHEGEFPRGARLHCRVGDELPMVARHAEASCLEALQQERIWLAQLWSGLDEFEVAGTRRRFRRDGNERPSALADSRHSLTSIERLGGISAYKKLLERDRRFETDEGYHVPPRGDLMPWRLSA